MKKFLAIILILVISAAVLCVVGAGVLALFPNQHLFNLPIAFVKLKTDKQLGALKITETELDLSDAFSNSNNVKFVVEAGSFDVSVEFLETQGLLYDDNDIYVVMNASVMGYTTSKDLEIKWYAELDENNHIVTLKTKQPNGWMLSNRCTLNVFIPRKNIKDLKINTNGNVNIKKGFTKIDKLDITSKSNDANNAMVYSPVGEFTLTSPNGSGNYEDFTFEGNLTINSDTGSFKFKQVNGNVKAEGTYMNLEITTLNGDLDYKVKYGKGIFTTIEKSAKFNSTGTDVTITNLKGSLVVEEGGNSTFTIEENGSSAIVNSANIVKLDKGKLNLKNSYYKTTINANGGEIKVENAKNIVEINPLLQGKVASSDSKPKIEVGFADNVSAVAGNLLTICTNGGTIKATNLTDKVYIESLEAKINAEFKNINQSSIIKAASADINVKVPNDQKFSIKAEVEEKDYISVDVGGVQTNSYASSVENINDGTWTLTYNFKGGSILQVLEILTRENLTITALGN